jgi:hypothetical protein
MSLLWEIERIINFGPDGQFKDGYARFAFHDTDGMQYVFSYNYHWVGCLSNNGEFIWLQEENRK